MSARDEIMDYVTANWTDTPVYALDDYVSLDDLPATNQEPILLLDFPSATERLVTIAVHERDGWREDGTVQLIMLHPIGQPSGPTRTLNESFRNLVRGRRIGATVTMAVDPFSALGQYDGKWQMYISLVDYYRDAFQ